MKYSDKLYDKIKTEYDNFIKKMQSENGKDVVEFAYEILIRDDIVMWFENDCPLTEKQCKALLTTKQPLDSLYNAWLKSDYSHMDMLRDSIRDEANTVMRLQAERNKGAER